MTYDNIKIHKKSGLRSFSKGYILEKPKWVSQIDLPIPSILRLKKSITIHNVIMLMNSVFNENHNEYCYNLLLEKCSHK